MDGSVRSISYSIGVSIPRAEWRHWRLWKTSRYSNIAFASLSRVRQRCRLRSSVCVRPPASRRGGSPTPAAARRCTPAPDRSGSRSWLESDEQGRSPASNLSLGPSRAPTPPAAIGDRAPVCNDDGMKGFVTALMLATALLLASPSPSEARPGPRTEVEFPDCHHGACYSYTTVSAPVSAPVSTTARGRFTVERPTLGTAGLHSLAELAVFSENLNHAVEVGWTVNPRLNNGSTAPHLFVFHWVNRQPARCYNACGFVRAPDAHVHPGQQLRVGAVINLRITHVQRRWAIFFNGREFGSFPDRLWQSPWPSSPTAQAFGEVARQFSRNGPVEMGNGIRGDRPGAATMSLSVPRATCNELFAPEPRYRAVSTGPCSMSYGGR